jgi:protein gp37
MFFAKYKDNVFAPPYVLNEPQYRKTKNDWYQQAAYPFGFEPTFHRYKLNEPQTWKKPRTIFVGSMCDLFGEWVPDEWIEDVFAACAAAPQHRYLFLTKNPKRYTKMRIDGRLPLQHWYGNTQTVGVLKGLDILFSREPVNHFISVEPMKGEVIFPTGNFPKWIIVGAETGNSKDKTVPLEVWIERLAKDCANREIPLFMKDSLIPIVGVENMRREFPWEVKQ